MVSGLDKTISRAARRSSGAKAVRGVITAAFPAGIEWRLELSTKRVVIGRASNDGVPAVPHETVSRSHVAIDYDARSKRHTITDLGSHNGSRLDGARLAEGKPRVLEDNAVVEVGDVLLVFERAVATAGASSASDVSAETIANIPGQAASVALARALISRAAPDPSPVLIVGETGTGKEFFAREVHRLSGRRGELLAINCAALSPQLIESQLFGHKKGAFTGAATDHDGFFVLADGGTLFLDELGELPAELQPKLLRVLQEGEVRPVGGSKTRSVDVRVIAATNRDLTTEVREGRFRRDLFARLALWEVALPALRDRRVDILMWIEFLHRAWADKRAASDQPPVFSVEAASAVLLHEWPDNLRGLDRLVHALSAATRADGLVDLEQLPSWISSNATEPARAESAGAEPPAADSASPATRLPPPTKEEFEAVLESVGGNVSALAKHYGRDRRQIYRWLESFGLRDKRQGRKPE